LTDSKQLMPPTSPTQLIHSSNLDELAILLL